MSRRQDAHGKASLGQRRLLPGGGPGVKNIYLRKIPLSQELVARQREGESDNPVKGQRARVPSREAPSRSQGRGQLGGHLARGTQEGCEAGRPGTVSSEASCLK